MQLVLDGIRQVVAVLGTGEEKSLLYMLLSRLQGAEMTVMIVSLISLKQDLICRCKEMRLGYKVWDVREEEKGRMTDCALMFVSVEKTVSRIFLKYLNCLEAGNTLDCVIFNESHLVLTVSKYCPKMRLIQELCRLRCQFLFLTATLPPSMMRQFEQKLLLLRPLIVCFSTLRTDLNYNIRHGGGLDLQRFALNEVHQVLQLNWFTEEARARCIIYIATWANADAVAKRLGCQHYYSDSGDEAVKAAALAGWIAGRPSVVMMAMSTFGLGINYAHMRLVVHLGPPRSAIDFTQEAGRLGWDRDGGIFLTYLPRRWEPAEAVDPAGELLPEECKAMQLYLDRPQYRKQPLSRFLDGGKGQACRDKETACDRCTVLGMVGEEEGGEGGKGGEEDGDGDGDDDDDPKGPRVEGGDGDGSGEESDEGDLEAGGELLRQHVRDAERGLRRYTDNLELLKAGCLVCRLLSGDGMGTEAERAAMHPLDACRSPDKHRFFAAKAQARQEGLRRFSFGRGGRTGWLSKYTACFGCGNPQNVCTRQGQETGQCKYRDIVMPACWAAYQREIWRKRTLPALAERSFSTYQLIVFSVTLYSLNI